MKYNKLFLVLVILAFGLQLNAQIGYQVSLLNSATGEPRANETVSVQVEITNSKGTVICSETKSATTNEFGMLSLQVGNASTFESVDWSKLPLYVSATVDGVMIGKSQILNVPVAEAAKQMVNIDLGLICRTWSVSYNCNKNGCNRLSLTFSPDMTYSAVDVDREGNLYPLSGKYFVHGNVVFLCNISGEAGYILPTCMIYDNGTLYGNSLTFFYKMN